ncbi:TorF family putative porin [Massilia sp. H6]|uniref:TorF family putative porin n=1 Tax=Massilia sp. H6 TaxID=2970464 RepID=UPI0021685D3D|nr:TorF family putative porin [Massilia sp. H6]UVW29347.1 TorF family putative porin [Massilia sp. H6]
MKRSIPTAAATWAALALASVTANAQQAAPDAVQQHQLSYNAAITSDYRYRGLSQTSFDPALQGGADYVHGPTGWYVGTWLSTIKWTKDLGGDGSIEWDIYGGRRGQLGASVTYDLGGLYYLYPSNGLGPSANTFELYGRLGVGPAYIKYSQSTTNLFGTANSKGSGYLDLGADLDVGNGFILNLHAGRQKVRHNSQFSYSDYKLGVSKDLGVATVSLAWIKADTGAYLNPQGKNLGKSGAILTVSKTF